MSTMKPFQARVVVKAVGLLLGVSMLVASAGCATVRPEQRAILADPTMQFDEKSADRAALEHTLDNREGSTGAARCVEAAAAAIEGVRVDASAVRVSRGEFAGDATLGYPALRAALVECAVRLVCAARRCIGARTSGVVRFGLGLVRRALQTQRADGRESERDARGEA
jgi:hypothetical protein